MAVYYVASKLSFVACKSGCLSDRRKDKSLKDRKKFEHNQNDKTRTSWISTEQLISMGISNEEKALHRFDEIPSTNHRNPEAIQCVASFGSAVVTSCDGIVTDQNAMILSGPLEALITLLIPTSVENLNEKFTFPFLLSSRLFIKPHELLGKLINLKPENDESLERLVVLMTAWTRWFPYDFRGEKIMSLVKHIVARCENNTRLSDEMSETLSALLIKLTCLSQHEEEMKSQKQPLNEDLIEWPNPSKIAQLLCHVEKTYAKHIGPEEFLQCSSNLIKEKSNYDVPNASISFQPSSPQPLPLNDVQNEKKKTCNLENYFEWSNRLRLMVANEILQCSTECDRTNKIELWTGVAQHCLLVGNYNSATSILEPIFRLQSMWKRFVSLANQQQLDCLLKHIEHSQNLNLWTRQTESSYNDVCNNNRRVDSQVVLTPNSSFPVHNQSQPNPSITNIPLQHQGKPKLDWVVLPVFVDIVKLALKAREDCSTRLPNGSINFCAFNELAAIVSAFTVHMSNVTVSSSKTIGEFNYLVNHILTCPLRDENELFAEFEREASKMESYYDVP